MASASLKLVDGDPENNFEAPEFADLWTLWPVRIKRMEAEKAWSKLTPAQQVAALTALVSWRSVWLAEGRLQYIPHCSTWLNQQRWTDELPETWGAGHASHVAAKLPEKGERAVMPESVRLLLAKMRAR